MIFGKRRQRIDAIADEVLDEYMQQTVAQSAYAIYGSQYMRALGNGELPKLIKARVRKECGSLVAMLLWTIISAVIQAAIKRWLDKRAKEQGGNDVY